MNNIGLYARALRLPFCGASILPFIFGSLINRGDFNFPNFALGFIAVLSTHLSANLLNDYADSKSGADWHDKTFFGLFGGSKLIQEGALSEGFYLRLALVFAFIAASCVVILSFLQNSARVIIYYAAILALAWSYSHKPLALSYRRLGEIVIFLLFGPAPVMGGYFLQTGIFPDAKGLILSLPFGFFTSAILFANEVPDFGGDKKAGKFTWVSLSGAKGAYLVYLCLAGLGFISIAAAVFSGYISRPALFSLILVIPALKALNILRLAPEDKKQLIASSQITIKIQTLAGVILILSLLL